MWDDAMHWMKASGALSVEEWERRQEEGSMSRGKGGEVIIYRAPVCAHTLDYLLLGHRRLEKEKPVPSMMTSKGAIKGATYAMPVDLLKVAGLPDDIVDQVESISLIYEKRMDV